MQRTDLIPIQALPDPDKVVAVDVELLDASPYQMRIDAYEDENDLRELANAIERLGMTALPMVRPSKKQGRFELMTGHRRTDAVKKYLHWRKVTVAVYESLSEATVMYLVGEDNMARRNIYPYEKGLYFNTWVEKFHWNNENLGILFHKDPKTIQDWRDLTDALDDLGDPLGGENKRKLIKNATRPKLELILSMKEDTEGRLEACLRIANGESLEQLQEFVKASENAHRKLSQSASTTGATSEAALDITKELESDLKKFNRAKTSEQQIAVAKSLTTNVQKTLDSYNELKAQLDQIFKAPNRATLKIEKKGTVKVYHKVHEDGSVLCVHEQDGKILAPVRFKI